MILDPFGMVNSTKCEVFYLLSRSLFLNIQECKFRVATVSSCHLVLLFVCDLENLHLTINFRLASVTVC